MARALNITIKTIAEFLDSRGYEVRAGNNDPAAFLADKLGCPSEAGKNRVRELLLSDDDTIYVTFDQSCPTRITAIGLQKWLDEADVALSGASGPDNTSTADTKQLLAVVQRQQRTIGELQRTLAERDKQLADARGDLDALVAMYDDELGGKNAIQPLVQPQGRIEQLEEQIEQLQAELATAKRKAEAARSARSAAVQERKDERALLNQRIAQFEALLAAAQHDAEMWHTVQQLRDEMHGALGLKSDAHNASIPRPDVLDLVLARVMDGTLVVAG